MPKRALVALIAVVLLPVLGSLFYLRPWDPLEMARRRVPLGGDEAAVIAALGRPPDGTLPVWMGKGRENVLYWEYSGGFDQLVVGFDEAGEAFHVHIDRDGRTLWERLRAWWPW
jgi:hypothetical protein